MNPYFRRIWMTVVGICLMGSAAWSAEAGVAPVIVPLAEMPRTVMNTVLSLSGATLATYGLSTLLRRGRTSVADMANAALAGGVAIGATCNVVAPETAFAIGMLAGALCVLGYVYVQPALEARFGVVDTCGVHNLHGMPGLLGGALIRATGTTRFAYEDRGEFSGID
jgi:ammonium transporter Rh